MAAEVFQALHHRLPQQGPGSDASTRKALALVPGLPAAPHILDLGCGPGRQSLVLAEQTGGQVTAVDLLPAFLEELEERATARGLRDRITTLQADMGRLEELPDQGFDLVWSEGAIYHLGFEGGLRSWRRLVRPTGSVAVTELSWLVAEPPDEPREFWKAAYPGMASTQENRRGAERAGYEVIADFTLPTEDWLAPYYDVLSERSAKLRAERGHELEVTAALDEADRERDLFRRHSDTYGYVFYVLRPS